MSDAVDEFLATAKHADGTSVADNAAADEFLSTAKHADGRSAGDPSGLLRPFAHDFRGQEQPPSVDPNGAKVADETPPKDENFFPSWMKYSALGLGERVIRSALDYPNRVRAYQADPNDPRARSPLGNIVRNIAEPVTDYANRDDKTFSGSLGVAANAAGGILASPLTLAGKAVPGVEPAMQVVGKGIDEGIAKPAGFLAAGMPDSPKSLKPGERVSEDTLYDPGTRGVTNLVAPLLIGEGLRVGGGATLRAAAETPGGRAFMGAYRGARTAYGEPIGPSAPTHTPGGIPLDAAGREAELQPTRIVGEKTSKQATLRAAAKAIPGYEELSDADKTIAAARARGEIPKNADAVIDADGKIKVAPRSGFRLPSTGEPTSVDASPGAARAAEGQGYGQEPTQGMRRGQSGQIILPDPVALGRLAAKGANLLGPETGDAGGMGNRGRLVASPAQPSSPVQAAMRVAKSPLESDVKSLGTDAERFGPGGAALEEDIRNIDARKRQLEGQIQAPYQSEVDRLSRSQKNAAQADMQDWAEGTKPAPAWAHPLVGAWQRAWGAAADAINKAGIRIVEKDGTVREITPGARKFPTRPKPESVAALETEAAAWRADRNAPTPLNDAFDQANRSTQDYQNPFKQEHGPDTGDAGRRQSETLESFYAGDERAHTYEWPRDMQVPNKLDVADYYMRRTTQNIAEQERMQYRHDVQPDPETGAPRTTKNHGVLQERLDAIGNRGVAGASVASEHAKTVFERAMGRNPADAWGPGATEAVKRTLARSEGFVTTLTKLGISVPHLFTRLGHIPALINEVGPVEAMRSLSRSAGEWSAALGRTKRSGAIRPGEGELMRTGVEDEPRTPSQSQQAIATVTRVGTYAADKIARFMQVAAAEAAPRHLANLAEGLRRGSGSALRAAQRLNLAPAEIEAIRSGEVSPLLRDKFTQSLADRISFAATRIDRPGLTANPRFATWHRFKAVPAIATRTFLETSIDNARGGKVAPLAGMIASAVGIYEAKHAALAALGKQPNPDEKGFIQSVRDKDLGGAVKYLLRATSSVGVGGWATDLASGVAENRPEHALERIILPPIASSIASGVEATQRARSRMTASDFAAKGRTPPLRGGKLPPSSRGQIWAEELWNLVAEEAPNVNRAVELAGGKMKK